MMNAMVETLKIDVRKIAKSRLKEVNFDDLPFGKVYADHMFVADFKKVIGGICG